MKVILVAASLAFAGVFCAEPYTSTYLTPEEAEKAVSMTGIGEWAKGVRDEDKAEDSDRKSKFDKCVDKFTVVYKLTQSLSEINGDNFAKCDDECAKKYHGDENYNHDEYKACYECCDSYYGRAKPVAPTKEYYSCQELKNDRPEVTTGTHFLHDAATGEVYKAFCDATTDGGGWTLVTDYNHPLNRVIVDIRKPMGAFLNKVVEKMETRFEVHTSSRVYRRYQKNVAARKDPDHDGNTAYLAVCATRYADGYGSAQDWGLNTNMEYTTMYTHAAASNKGPNNWRYNVNEACHRALASSDGSATYVANWNTPAAQHGWPNTFCGGIRARPTDTAAAGCDIGHRFIQTGPEGQVQRSYFSDINDIARIKIWVRASTNDK